MRRTIVASGLAFLSLAGCSCCGHDKGLPPCPDRGPAPGIAVRPDRNALPGRDYAAYVAARERRGEGGPGVDVAGVWARTRQDGGAYFAGGGSSADDTHMKVNKAP
jgi:hypothetical protein